MLQAKIFISYAREQGNIAGRLAHHLLTRRNVAYEVYYDLLSLRSGDSWDEKINDQINQSDLFIYLISPDSVAPESYCHNELAVFKARGSQAVGRLLPVMVVPTDPALIDAYVMAIKYEEPKGDPATYTAWLADLMIKRLKGEHAKTSDDEIITETSTSAMRDESQIDHESVRSFIQRAEVRLSTMHRVAGSFISGAGLVVLVPFLLRDAATTLIDFFVRSISSTGFSWRVLTSLWIGAFAAAVYLTFLSLYFLLRDLIRFYFVPHNQDDAVLFPRYAISALSYPAPKNDITKQQILLALYSSQIYKFGMHRNQRSIDFYNLVDKEYDFVKPDGREEFERLRSPGELRDTNERHLYNVACGVAGVSERTLIEEAARVEASLVRHNTGLRGIVIRYAKALLLTLWTAVLMLFAIATTGPIARETGETLQAGLTNSAELGCLLSVFFVIWALVAMRLVKHPLYWISEMAELLSTQNRRPIVDHDPQFKQFESQVRWLCGLALIFCLASLSASASVLAGY